MANEKHIEMYLQFRQELDRYCIPVILDHLNLHTQDIYYDGKIAGMLCCSSFYIDCIYILPEYRRRGLAKKAVTAFVKENITNGIRLHIINNNETAKAFWHSLFRLAEVEKNVVDTLYEIVKIKD